MASRGKRLAVSSHLFKTLRERLADTPAVGKEYEAVSDRFGYILGLINEDPRDQLPENVYTPSPPVGDVTTNWYPTSGPPLLAGCVGTGWRDDGDSLVVEHCCYL